MFKTGSSVPCTYPYSYVAYYFSKPVNTLSVNIEVIQRYGVIFFILGECLRREGK